MNGKTYLKLGSIFLIVALVAMYFVFDLDRYLSVEALKHSHEDLMVIKSKSPIAFLVLFFLGYVVLTTLSLPGGAIYCLAAGALFGTIQGTVVVVIASTIGATFAFLAARYILKEWVQVKFRGRLQTIRNRANRDGAFYLFTLRLIPILPFILVNGGIALTSIRTVTYIWVSLIGLIPLTLIYTNAGTELSKLESVRGILSPSFLISLILIGIFPLFTKRILKSVHKHRNKSRGL